MDSAGDFGYSHGSATVSADEAMHKLRKLLTMTNPESMAGKVLRETLPILDGIVDRAEEARKQEIER